ncbi:MAG: hypothetical protein KIT16_14280 [Rhodospirillaceae bacterium]|nr:hypothetical protein [Rhodospirillaceae bacterium]
MGSIYRQVPLIGVLAILYLIVAAVFEGVLDKTLFHVSLPSGRDWIFGVRDLFVIVGLFLLYLEVLKSTRSGRAQIVEHIFSMLVFVGCLLLFLLVAKTGTTTFLLITVMEAIDVIAGFTVSIVAARRDMEIERVSA